MKICIFLSKFSLVSTLLILFKLYKIRSDNNTFQHGAWYYLLNSQFVKRVSDFMLRLLRLEVKLRIDDSNFLHSKVSLILVDP